MTHALKSPGRLLVLASAIALPAAAVPQEARTVPVIRDGEAPGGEGFRSRADWIRDDPWVEAPFDSDRDGKPDRRPASSEARFGGEEGLSADVDIIPLTAEAALPYKLDRAFYKKCATVQGILIASSDKVPDVAYLETAYLFDRVMKSIAPAVAQRIRDQKVICILIGRDELTSELPQFTSDRKGKELDFYNWRNRGFLTRKEGHPTLLFSEEDVLEYEGGMQLESILIHEFGHVIDGAGFDKELKDRLTRAYQNAKEKGLWNDGYAAQRFRRVTGKTPVRLHDALVKSFPAQSAELLRTCLDSGDILVNGKPTHSKIEVTSEDKVLIVFGGPKPCYATVSRAEYWAEGVQSWYDTNRTLDHDHNHIHTREQLKGYDPDLAKLCEEVLGDAPWRFVSPRTRAGTEHLKDYDPAKAPKRIRLEHLEAAAQDYYDGYWKSYWKRLYDKHGLSEDRR